MKRIGILIGWLVWAAGASAQSWSLDDCMKYAVEHATEVKREVVNARQRKQDYLHAVEGFLPTVSGGVQGQYAWGRNIDPETNTYNNVTTFNNYYQGRRIKLRCPPKVLTGTLHPSLPSIFSG